jgi:hypothetical protein
MAFRRDGGISPFQNIMFLIKRNFAILDILDTITVGAA